MTEPRREQKAPVLGPIFLTTLDLPLSWEMWMALPERALERPRQEAQPSWQRSLEPAVEPKARGNAASHVNG